MTSSSFLETCLGWFQMGLDKNCEIIWPFLHSNDFDYTTVQIRRMLDCILFFTPLTVIMYYVFTYLVISKIGGEWLDQLYTFCIAPHFAYSIEILYLWY